MNVTRRQFLGGMAGILAAKVAPAFVGSSILMPVRVIEPISDTTYRWWRNKGQTGAWQQVGPFTREELDRIANQVLEFHMKESRILIRRTA